jgi:hypothetical protein
VQRGLIFLARHVCAENFVRIDLGEQNRLTLAMMVALKFLFLKLVASPFKSNSSAS